MDQFVSYVMGTGADRAELLRLLREKHKEYETPAEELQRADRASSTESLPVKQESEDHLHPLFRENMADRFQEPDLHMQLQNHNINLPSMDDAHVKELKSQVAKEYETLARQFAAARIANIDQLVEKIDDAISSTKEDFVYLQRQMGALNADGFEKRPVVESPACDPDLFYNYFATSYADKMKLLSQIAALTAYRLEAIDRETDTSIDIVHSQYRTALLENREALQQQIQAHIDELNAGHPAQTGESSGACAVPENELKSRKKRSSSLINLADIAQVYGDDKS
ncbi:hypothetical protein KL905_002394 [Ogataea polymorpha]|nr:hypothetical protein KL937_001982 [Ogataea polymorpha]KAG7889216.1 hypothetical protein KL936_002790 [Ogataea polymorpha]KAG7899658.1 hypothetical protein KL935_003199 [Ogataea polymorpha]KAG7921629.1 hypothetical protein KL905_002394 [Ogataea polymorpha]KAG7934485.1 hypothetical protein KL934_002411 [Ogataea polymorpha]